MNIDTPLYLDGEWRPAISGKRIAVSNPATGEVIGYVAHAGEADLARALPRGVPQAPLNVPG